MKKINVLAISIASVFLLVGAGCASEPEETSAKITITELGIVVTAPAGYGYSHLDEGVYNLTTPGGSKTVTLQSFGPPDVPAEAVASPAGLAEALGSFLDNFEVVDQEEFENGFILDYTVETDEAFSAIINTNEGTILCEPEFGAFTFEFDDLKDLCRSVK